MFESWDFDGCRCLFPWKRGSELEAEPVSTDLGAPDSWGRRPHCISFIISPSALPQADRYARVG